MRQQVHIPLPDGGSLAATMALPEGEAPPGGWPGAVVVHEIYGVEPDMLDVVDLFAAHGYAAVLPDLYSHGSRVGCLARVMHQLSTGRPGQPNADIDTTRRWLAGREDVDGDRLGVIGFCMGGGFALAYAAGAPPGVRAASVNYGMVPRDPEELRPVCPVVGSYGGRDRGFRSHGARLRGHMRALGIEHDVEIYPAAGHSFMTDGRHPVARLALFPLSHGHVAAAADDAWRRTFAFFDEHVAGHA
ncbi:dienelactone hydrolase family protein [Nonomuraea roseoviolacea]|uniref:Carboxymethylenebutenolidase n=1 Tax=Nonomuraea roseoviolacea subsp. carminata TaxID=160689 RepID=A0ABT1K2Z7_9ACTN|nr:dienelactone hydrolase family protein [Nonomuraea roseoviolacea]MCP2348365.1 carboxymethylenebutenolidase [Nonomuraea roseoviolacea subsp. carminata]